MKKYFIMLPFILFFAISLFFSCDKLDDLKQKAGAQLVVAILVSDGTNVRPFAEESGGKDLQVKITGEHKDLVKGSMQESISLGTYIINTDIVKLSDDNPLEFTLVVSADGYLTTGKTYYFSENRTRYDYLILTNLEKDNAGVDSVTVQRGSAQNGMIESEFTVSTAQNRAKIIVPAGIILKFDDGTLLEGDLTTTIAHFDAGDPRALAAFPGSLSPVVTDKDGNKTPVRFTSAGFVSVDITDASGIKASQIENGSIDISIAAAQTTINQETGEPVKEGDTIPFWSFDESNGQWNYEGEETFEAGDIYIPGTRSTSESGGLNVRTSITHLSSYNLDYYQNACSLSARINLINTQKGKAVHLNVLLENEGYPQRFMVNDDFLQLNNAPKNVRTTIQVAQDIEQEGDFDPLTEIIKLVKDILDPPGMSHISYKLVIDDLCEKKEYTLDVSKVIK